MYGVFGNGIAKDFEYISIDSRTFGQRSSMPFMCVLIYVVQVYFELSFFEKGRLAVVDMFEEITKDSLLFEKKLPVGHFD